MENKLTKTIIKSTALLLGLVSLGYFIYASRAPQNYVTVKGMSVREVKANDAVFEIDFKEVGGNLIQLSKKLAADQQIVATFLKKKGFTDAEITALSPKVSDAFANSYSPGNTTQDRRYTVSGGIMINSENVDQVQQLSQGMHELLAAGVPLNFDSPSIYPNPSYIYTSLDTIRPAMLAEANTSARKVAEQFASDSDSRLASIRHATQGQFQIMSRDSDETGGSQQQLSSVYKKVRLVTTVDYNLK